MTTVRCRVFRTLSDFAGSTIWSWSRSRILPVIDWKPRTNPWRCWALLCVRNTLKHERKVDMSVVQTVESRGARRGTAPVGRLFVLDISGGHVFSFNPDGSGKKILVSDCRLPD